MAKLDQNFESNAFSQMRSDEIKETSAKLTNYVLSFVTEAAKKNLPCGVLLKTSELIDNSDFSTLGTYLRQFHTEFSTLFPSQFFWSVIDAISAFVDATGSSWPYMTQEVRNARLGHVSDYIREFPIPSI